ncbi:MAG TPA: hypothetical protein DDX98_04930 [Bacteroidales bacterium]|jgi:adenylate cyclase|nr:hypothetical protein [Bacteroidales bacterium]
MLLKEKLFTRFNLFFRNLLFHLLFWYLSLLFFIFLSGDSDLFISYFNLLKVESIYLILAILSLGIAVLFTVFNSLFSDRFMRFSSVRLMVIIRSFLYFSLAFLIIVLASHPPNVILAAKSLDDWKAVLPDFNRSFFRFMVFFYLVCFLNNFLRQMVKLIGKGIFRNWIFGMLNKPREEERIFMFIDMKASTAIAEKLLHKRFSHLVQDVFNDMAIVDNYLGEIYQYLGDGAIVSWNLQNGIQNNNFLKAFFAFSKVVERRHKYYIRKYGLTPRFKAGFHVGKIMVLQVGRIRRDISYNGDTLNTAARIESMCKEFRQDVLISGDLYHMMREKKGFAMKMIGNIKLRGKRKALDIYQVRKIKP